MVKTKVLLIFGGQSSEHDISIRSAHNVLQNIDSDKFTTKLAYIDPDGRWFAAKSIDITSQQPIQIDLVKQVFVVDSQSYRPDVMLPVLHGQNGEDGMVAALGQILNIAVAGCDMTSGAVGMDKLLTKQIVNDNNVAIVPYRVVRRGHDEYNYNQLSDQLGKFLFVKPTRSGSSVGVSRVSSQKELNEAVELAFKYDDLVLIEQAMVGREFEVAVLGDSTDPIISPIGEIILDSSDTFYSYDSKYSSSSKTTVSSSVQLDPKISNKIRQAAHTVYKSLRCSGLARIDFFLVDDKPFFNEINTFPGFTDISMYPKMIEQAGISQTELITRLLKLALEKN